MKLYYGDCLEVMASLPSSSIRLALFDPPYGTTSCKWDIVIPSKPMWMQLERLLVRNGTIVMFGQEPFSSSMRVSNISQYKFDLVWRKNRVGGHLNAKNAPLKEHENIMVFSKGTIANCSENLMLYNPIGTVGVNISKRESKRKSDGTVSYRKSREVGHSYTQTLTNYPKSVLEFDVVRKPIHPTEKPVALLEYLIKMFSNEGDSVLDISMGSGSTGEACIVAERDFIGIEKDKEWFDKSVIRLGKDNVDVILPGAIEVY